VTDRRTDNLLWQYRASLRLRAVTKNAIAKSVNDHSTPESAKAMAMLPMNPGQNATGQNATAQNATVQISPDKMSLCFP